MKSFHFSHRQILYFSAGAIVIGLLCIHYVNNYFIQSRQLNAAGLNAQTIATMVTHGEALVQNTNLAVAAVSHLSATDITTTAKTKNSYSAPAWQLASHKSGTPSIPLSDRVSLYQIVEIETHPKNFPIIGQQIHLPLFNDQSVAANVEMAQVHANGDYSWRGHLSGHGSDYPVAMTYGEKGVFATITTPEGSYTMESVNGLGWLYKNPSEPELTTPGANDFAEPPNVN